MCSSTAVSRSACRPSTRTRRSFAGWPARSTAGAARRGSWWTRLLLGALIEARSCERFKLLAEAAASRPEHAALERFWSDLLAAEARHYRMFVDLAERAAGGDRTAVVARLDRLADGEGAVVRDLARRADAGSRATMHG